MLKKIIAFHRNEDGGGLVETAIIISMLAVLSIGAFIFLGPKIKSLFTKTGDELDKGATYIY